MVNKVTNTRCTCIYWGDEDLELRSETTRRGEGWGEGRGWEGAQEPLNSSIYRKTG